MNEETYRWLGGVSIALAIAAVAVAIRILTGRHSRRDVYASAGTVLILMLVISAFCLVIWSHYKPDSRKFFDRSASVSSMKFLGKRGVCARVDIQAAHVL